ncbi:uncharacterized protein EV154DRAFT_499832 [Mucor mucedo]|uniref:uncharacterized protein n=1 Tax=Mucor mucedo TaxID=29922 RepID=UPI00221EB8A3|nr:uncharacterized protein EV154DRAFT_499832 [Mucor mucedo]KAI7893984.1 hypothetical protein EV154DRAFT_499832 [Mucor mucedo]
MKGSDEDHQEKNKRPIFSKYAIIPHTTPVDKNLIVEKAKFESSSGSNLQQLPTTSISTPTVVPNHEQKEESTTKSPPLTTSVTLPMVATIQSLSGASTPAASMISAMPSQSTPLMPKPKPKVEDRRTIKRKKMPPMSGTATPSEVFHRNLVDAVSNVEDSDENEQYVYPYSGNNTDTTYHVNSTDTIHRTTSSLYRPQSTRSFINIQQDLLLPAKKTGFLGEFLRPILFKNKSDSRAILQQQRTSSSGDEQLNNRPKLRNYVMDHPFNSQSKLNSSGEWLDSGSPPHHSRRNTKKLYSNYLVGDGGYTTDDEEAQHLLSPRRSPERHRKSYSTCSRLIRNFLITVLAIVVLLMICIAYLAKPLVDLNVEMGRVLSSDKELIFDLHINALNSNFWTVHVADADISVFAFSQVVPMLKSDDPDIRGVDPAEYLGGFYHFDEPLSFSTSFYSKEPVTAISQIRIKSPGADKSGNERWSRIIRYPYGLVVRGVLKYKPLPFLSPQSVAICDVVRVDPTTGKVSEDPDQGFCLSYNSYQTTLTTPIITLVNDTIDALSL